MMEKITLGALLNQEILQDPKIIYVFHIINTKKYDEKKLTYNFF